MTLYLSNNFVYFLIVYILYLFYHTCKLLRIIWSNVCRKLRNLRQSDSLLLSLSLLLTFFVFALLDIYTPSILFSMSAIYILKLFALSAFSLTCLLYFFGSFIVYCIYISYDSSFIYSLFTWLKYCVYMLLCIYALSPSVFYIYALTYLYPYFFLFI